MASKQDLAARARAASVRRNPEPPPAEPAAEQSPQAAPARRAVTVRTKPVRITTDLSPRAYQVLQTLTQNIAADAGRSRLPHSEVLRALIEELGDDPGLAERISKRVTQ